MGQKAKNSGGDHRSSLNAVETKEGHLALECSKDGSQKTLPGLIINMVWLLYVRVSDSMYMRQPKCIEKGDEYNKAVNIVPGEDTAWLFLWHMHHEIGTGHVVTKVGHVSTWNAKILSTEEHVCVHV